jgi:ABC-type branched-subunit amino acid transport system ATPase component
MNDRSFIVCAVASRGAVETGTTSAATSERDRAGGADPLVELREIEFAYGPVQVLFGVGFTVERGEIIGLLGTNGAGKSTVLRVLAGLDPPARGTVIFEGRDVTAVPAEKLCSAGIALVMGGKAVFPDLTVRENLQLAGFTVRAGLGDRIERELERFPQLRLRLESKGGSLSGGEQQQLALAKALLLDPKLLCIDELSLGLSPTIVSELFEVIRGVNAAGCTCVLVEQSLNIAAQLCGRAVFLEKGAVKFEGPAADLLERGDLARAVFLGENGARRTRTRKRSR